tara:strand:- start:2177 stop:3364 length:1188 start_codon:yes stop_codon:yes gene_type:complete
MKLKYLAIASFALLAFSCKKDDDDNTTTSNQTNTLKAQVVESYSELVYRTYSDAYDRAVEMEAAINAFVANPSESTHQAAKTAWLEAREPYGLSEAFRFGEGPIDDEDGPEGLLNAWPLDESYIDYTYADANSGIINDTVNYPTLDKATLESLNEAGGETNISVGYHAVEFLLWGQDLNPNGNYDNAGQRSYTDYEVGTTANASRRADYLVYCAEMISSHLQDLRDEWAAGESNYRAQFTSAPVDESLAKLMKGMSILSKGELAGERIYVAIANQDQEDEHSCFSDNTHRDIITNAQGISNVFFCNYGGTTPYTGYSLHALLTSKNATLSSETAALISGSVGLAENMHIPFDEALTNPSDRDYLLELVANLQQQGDKLVDAGSALGISITAELPE